MMRCRMCSQRLTRPGRLCRECEHELDRSRAAASVDTLSSAMPLIDATRAVEPASGWSARLRTRPVMLAVAFAVGVAGAATFHLTQPTGGPGGGSSVMLDRDLTRVTPRSTRTVAPAVPPPTSASGGVERAASPPRAEVGRARIEGETPGAGRRRVVQVAESGTPVMLAVTGATVPTASPAAPAPFDRVLALSHAIDACAKESLFDRIACEQHARTRYCAGIESQVPQCGAMSPRDHGK